jgi:hypothetical protein
VKKRRFIVSSSLLRTSVINSLLFFSPPLLFVALLHKMSPAPKKIPLASSLKGSPSALRMASTGANAAAAAVVAAAIANRATATTTTTNNNNNIDAAPRRTNALPNSNYSSMLFLSNNYPDLAATMALVAFLRAEADAADQKAKSFRRQAQQLAVQFGIHDNVQQRYEIDPQQLPPLDEHGVPKYRVCV